MAEHASIVFGTALSDPSARFQTPQKGLSRASAGIAAASRKKGPRISVEEIVKQELVKGNPLLPGWILPHQMPTFNRQSERRLQPPRRSARVLRSNVRRPQREVISIGEVSHARDATQTQRQGRGLALALGPIVSLDAPNECYSHTSSGPLGPYAQAYGGSLPDARVGACAVHQRSGQNSAGLQEYSSTVTCAIENSRFRKLRGIGSWAGGRQRSTWHTTHNVGSRIHRTPPHSQSSCSHKQPIKVSSFCTLKRI
jgi:hypothetical protein